MDETRFQTLINAAIGEEAMPQWLPARVRERLVAPRARSMRGRFALAVAVLAILLATGVIEGQVLLRRSAPLPLPAATPSVTSLPSPLAVDPSGCRLPVGVERGSGPPTKLAYEVGFLDTKTGRYTRDGSATVAGLPGSGALGPGSYSSTAHRWLPVLALVSPDGWSYAWVQTLPVGVAYPKYTSSELHVYDLATDSDRQLWTYHGAIDLFRWDDTGILVNAGPVKSNAPLQAWWLIDPAAGAAARHAAPPGLTGFSFKPLPGDPHDLRFTSVGVDGQGHRIWWIYDLDRPGAVNWVFYETSPGQRVTIYRGTQGDAMGFDPTGGAMADSTGIWFADNEHHTLWHWRQGVGLRKVTIVGLPSRLTGANSYVQVHPAGPCF